MKKRAIVHLALIAALCATENVFAGDTHWVGTWGCGIQLTEPRNLPPPPGLTSNTLRQIVHSSIGGKQLRVHFSNIFGTNAVEMNSAHIALNPGAMTSSTIDPATDTALKFGGVESTAIPAGKDVWSDPVTFDLPPLTNLAITIYLRRNFRRSHRSSQPPGALPIFCREMPSRPPTWTGAIKTEHWYNIEDVDVMADKNAGALVTFGDSITDGRGSTTGGNNRWPDDLAVRLHTNPPTAGVSVINTGIGGNAIFGGLGPAGVKRFDRDVLNQSGVRWVIVFEGVNDIGGARGAARRHAGDKSHRRLHAVCSQGARERHLRIYGATITPFGGNDYYSR